MDRKIIEYKFQEFGKSSKNLKEVRESENSNKKWNNYVKMRIVCEFSKKSTTVQTEVIEKGEKTESKKTTNNENQAKIVGKWNPRKKAHPSKLGRDNGLWPT